LFFNKIEKILFFNQKKSGEKRRERERGEREEKELQK
jgi:hypothetical protein